jgi:hypothetical protein
LYIGAFIPNEEINLIATIADHIFEEDLSRKNLNEELLTVTGETVGLLVERGLKGVLVDNLMF